MSIRLENNIDYYIPISNLFHEREVNKVRRCDFLVQGHKKYSQYQNETPEDIIVGRPFFERFYVVFNYSNNANMTMMVGPREHSHVRKASGAPKIV